VVELLPSKQAVASSSLVSRSNQRLAVGDQPTTIWAYSSAVERPAHNRLVPGSNPGRPIFPYLWS
jgi:hypothetical protein